MTVLLRAENDPTTYVSSVREAVRHLDPGVALRGVGTLQTEVTDSIGIIRNMGILMGLFGAAALALSSMGVYGVLSESVAQRTREFGIRLAMGASSRDVLKLVLGQAFRLTLIGTAIAVPVAIALSRLMASLIYGVVALNLAMIGEFAVALFFVALLAGYVPAKRAMNVDPIVALRYE
jgi:putative ABC transport system permease protein